MVREFLDTDGATPVEPDYDLPTAQAEEVLSNISPVMKAWSKEQKQAAMMLDTPSIKFLVRRYYDMQERRIADANQIRSGGENPNQVLQVLLQQDENVELRIKQALNTWSLARPEGVWLHSQMGIGPVLASGLIAMIPMETIRTAGQIHALAGMDPNRRWIGVEEAKKIVKEIVSDKVEEHHIHMICTMIGIKPESMWKRFQFLEKSETPIPVSDVTRELLTKAISLRPWNAKLKVLAWKCGQSFVMFSKKDECFYGQIFAKRKAYEMANNELRRYSDQAADILVKKNIGVGTDAYGYYQEGKLPPAHIQARAERYAAKFLISHYHEVAYFYKHRELAPAPYIFSKGGHTDYVEVPNLDVVPELKEAKLKAKR